MVKNLRPYQKNDYIKDSNSKNLFEKPKSMVLASQISQQKKERLKSWITLYRNNMWIFVEHYMGVKLFPYQRYWITLMGKSTDFLAIASRASAKSWLIATYSIARCILYPGTIVALNSSTKAQAGLIISEKCVELIKQHPNIYREVSGWVTNQNKWEVTFHNNSKINVVISGEGGRGHRSHVSVLEERRLIPTEIIDSIIRPFAVVRRPPYLQKLEYSHLVEEPQEITITSAYYKSHEWWLEAKKLLRMIADGNPDIKGIFLDYLIILKHGIKTKKYMEKEKKKLDPVTFLMEYGNVPFSASSSSFYKIGFFNRKIKHGWLPQKDDFVKKNPYDIKCQPGEKRIVSVDIAMRRGSYNDNTIITCARLFPTKKGWFTEISYVESHNGRNAMLQALRIKQVYSEFTDFDGVLVIDVANAGIAVYDVLTTITKDDARGKEYPPLTIMKHWAIDDKVYEELKDRTLGQNAIECIFPISGNVALNSAIAVSFRDRLKRKLVSFLVDDNTQESFLIKSGNKDILDQDDDEMRAYLLQSHIQTTLMINECISLEMSIVGNGQVKVQEPPGSRKDRFTSCAYLNYVVGLMDQELLKEEDDTDEWSALEAVTFVM